jgi:hypothetical protein
VESEAYGFSLSLSRYCPCWSYSFGASAAKGFVADLLL